MRVSTSRLSIRTRSNSTRARGSNGLTHHGGTKRDSREWRRSEKEKQGNSSERLEDNAIIRNYRVRPRFAELSHSVSITGTVIPAYPTPLHVNSCTGVSVDVRWRVASSKHRRNNEIRVHGESRGNVNIILGFRMLQWFLGKHGTSEWFARSRVSWCSYGSFCFVRYRKEILDAISFCMM